MVISFFVHYHPAQGMFIFVYFLRRQQIQDSQVGGTGPAYSPCTFKGYARAAERDWCIAQHDPFRQVLWSQGVSLMLT